MKMHSINKICRHVQHNIAPPTGGTAYDRKHKIKESKRNESYN